MGNNFVFSRPYSVLMGTLCLNTIGQVKLSPEFELQSLFILQYDALPSYAAVPSDRN